MEKLTITFKSQTYTHSIEVENPTDDQMRLVGVIADIAKNPEFDILTLIHERGII